MVLHNTPRGVHFFSTDGLEWHLHQQLNGSHPLPPYFFDEVVHYTDGTSTTVSRRERPWILFNADGSPRALVTSMAGGNRKEDSATWTMVQETSAGSTAWP